MAEYVTKEQVIDWYRPYGQTDEPIPFEILVSDLKDMDAADVAPVRYGRWKERKSFHAEGSIVAKCSACQKDVQYLGNPLKFCPNCGAKMDLEG